MEQDSILVLLSGFTTPENRRARGEQRLLSIRTQCHTSRCRLQSGSGVVFLRLTWEAVLAFYIEYFLFCEMIGFQSCYLF